MHRLPAFGQHWAAVTQTCYPDHIWTRGWYMSKCNGHASPRGVLWPAAHVHTHGLCKAVAMVCTARRTQGIEVVLSIPSTGLVDKILGVTTPSPIHLGQSLVTVHRPLPKVSFEDSVIQCGLKPGARYHLLRVVQPLRATLPTLLTDIIVTVHRASPEPYESIGGVSQAAASVVIVPYGV